MRISSIMTGRLHTIGLAAVLFAALATFGCTSLLKENAQNAADEAKEAAQCAKDNAPPDSPEVIFATAKAKDAETYAQKAVDADNAAQKAIDEANAKVKEADTAVTTAETELKQAETEAIEASKDLKSAKAKVAAGQAYEAAKTAKTDAENAAGGARAIETLLARAKRGDDLTEDEIVLLKNYQNGQNGFVSADTNFTLVTNAQGADRDRVAAEAQAYITNAEEKQKNVESKRQELETKKKQAAAAKTQADALTQNASKVAAALVEANANAADKAADDAAHAAAKIPKCRDLAHRLRPDTFDPLARIRPHGADLFGAQGARKGPSGGGGGGHPSGGGGGGGGGGPEGP
jgi:chromosome segregation protein